MPLWQLIQATKMSSDGKVFWIPITFCRNPNGGADKTGRISNATS